MKTLQRLSSTMDDILNDSTFIMLLSKKIETDWLELGRFLSIKDSVLDIIDHEQTKVTEKAYKMLCQWRDQQEFPRLDILARGLYQAENMDSIKWIEEQTNKSFGYEQKSPLKPTIESKIEMREALKKFYLKTFGKMDEIVHNKKNPTRVELLNKFVELTVVDAEEVEKDTVNILELKLFLQKQKSYKPIEFNEVFSNDLPLLLISGIAGIGKTWLLRKCLLDWASGSLWQNEDLVLHLECRKLNQYETISDINELLQVFYKDIFKGCNVYKYFSILFVIDGLDEFAYLDELINHDCPNPSKYSIVDALADALDIEKHKCVVAGRVGAILQYKDKLTEDIEKLNIQIMGFNENGVNEYVEKTNYKKAIKHVLKSSYIARAMAPVPFYLSAMCTIIGTSKLSDSYSFFSMTELYCCIFLYFFQKHVCKSNQPVYKMMQSENSWQYILRVCKVAWHLFNQGKVVFSQKEIKEIVNDLDNVENELFGFIEKVESQLGYQYQFVHLTLMEFCASVHSHIYLSPEEIISNKRLHSCLPMICGLKNENEGCFVRLLANLRNSNEQKNSLLNAVLDTSLKPVLFRDDHKMFVECFFEAQASITEDMKRSIAGRWWTIDIDDRKTAHEVSHENYFIEKFIDSGFKLRGLNVKKNILSEDEKKLLKKCLTNVRWVNFHQTIMIDGWNPKNNIECLWIDISKNFVSKNDFERFLPWIRLTEKLNLLLHDDTNFIDDICEWFRELNFMFKNNNCLWINYRGTDFYSIESLKKFAEKKCLIF